MRQRDFVTLLSGATAWVAPPQAQEPRRVIGILSGGFSNPDQFAGGLAAFFQGLKESGFVEGKNISIEFSRADGDYDRLPSLAAELVGRNVSVIWTNDVPSAFAAKAATKTIPIVFSVGADPVKIGLVESLSRPDSNLTGMTVFFSVLGQKHVEFLHELLPAVNTIALLGNPDNANFQPVLPDIRAATAALKRRLEVLTARTGNELDAAFATMAQRRVGALIVVPDPLLISRREQLVELAARGRRMLQAVIVDQPVEPRRLNYALRSRFGKFSPEVCKRFPRGLAAADREAVGEHDSVHRAGARRADAIDLESRLLEQPIQHAPGKGAVSASTLKRKVGSLDLRLWCDGLHLSRCWTHVHRFLLFLACGPASVDPHYHARDRCRGDGCKDEGDGADPFNNREHACPSC
jgi:putative ABC transport system substrate-binding protein